MRNDYFKEKAAGYDKANHRVANVETIARAMLDRIPFDKTMNLMDFGSGTGLLLQGVAPFVHKITAVDISASMNQQLEMKRDSLGCELEILEVDLSRTILDRKFDGIISSMTMHHVEDIGAMFAKFHALLEENGFIAIADLDAEDGSFHSEDTGVFHSGFDRKKLVAIAEEAGFRNIDVTTASVISKPQGDYPVFLLTATRQTSRC